MSLRVPVWLLPILGLSMILLSLSLRVWPFATIHVISPLLAGMGVGVLGAIFVLPVGKNWTNNWNDKIMKEWK